MTTKELLALVGRWRSENGDYPESKRDCADELEAALPALCAEVEALTEALLVAKTAAVALEISRNDTHAYAGRLNAKVEAAESRIAQQDATIARMREALEACIDYGSMTDDGWVTDKARAALNQGEVK